jgi:hypothetical protein
MCVVSGGFLIYTLVKATPPTPPSGSLVKENTSLSDIIAEVPEVLTRLKEPKNVTDEILANIPENLNLLQDTPNILKFLQKHDKLQELSERVAYVLKMGISKGSSLAEEVGNHALDINTNIILTSRINAGNEDRIFLAYVDATCAAADLILNTPA